MLRAAGLFFLGHKKNALYNAQFEYLRSSLEMLIAALKLVICKLMPEHESLIAKITVQGFKGDFANKTATANLFSEIIESVPPGMKNVSIYLLIQFMKLLAELENQRGFLYKHQDQFKFFVDRLCLIVPNLYAMQKNILVFDKQQVENFCQEMANFKSDKLQDYARELTEIGSQLEILRNELRVVVRTGPEIQSPAKYLVAKFVSK